MGSEVTLTRKISAYEKELIADQMREYALARLHGPVSEPASWRGAIRRLGCKVQKFHLKRGPIAFYHPKPIPNYPLGIVTFNVALCREDRLKGLVHECGHVLQREIVPWYIFDAETVYSYHDDPRVVSHQIASLFEKMIVEA